jgi:hypothetical protein
VRRVIVNDQHSWHIPSLQNGFAVYIQSSCWLGTKHIPSALRLLSHDFDIVNFAAAA